jgi:Transposase IS4
MIRPAIEHLNAAFQKDRTPAECQSVDEKMVKFKGYNIMRQYVKGKPVEWGFKLWMRCGSQSSYTYQIIRMIFPLYQDMTGREDKSRKK